MSSSRSNANHPRIPGRCDICDLKDGKRNMRFVQCSKCKVCVHRECYMVYPEDDVEEFVCYACAAVGRTYQAVDTHMSNRFYEIEQKERPVECALCSVKDGIHAMYPLFDYHGTGGRQICVTKKSKDKSGSRGEKKLVWAHALCALYLASVGFVYACFKDGDYLGMEEGEDDTDSRPPNPELKFTKEFSQMYGRAAMPHFRYFMTPPDGAMDLWTKSILDQKQLKCIECGKVDDKKSMRIPLQCVANDPDEFTLHRKRHRERNNDVSPCTQALHVGCARWGDPSSKVRKCYYFPGSTNQDGSLAGNLDTVHCLYCKNHAENVDENHQKIVKKDTALLQKKRVEENDPIGELHQRTIRSRKIRQKVLNSSKDRVQHKSKIREKRSMPKASRTLGKHKMREPERYKELDPSLAVAINAGEQPTLAKRRRRIANEKSIVTKEDVNLIFDDLVRHRDEIARNPTSMLNGRKRYWKHEFSEVSTMDFDSIWNKARKRFDEYQSREENLDSNQSSSFADVENAGLPPPPEDKGEKMRIVNAPKNVSRRKNRNAELNNDLDNDDDSDISERLNEQKNNSDETESSDGNLKKRKSRGKPEMSLTGEPPPDRWSKLFIGQPFEMGHEFTIDKFGKKM